MYELITHPCRQIFQQANREATLTRSDYISAGHVLIALTDAEADPIAELLRSSGARPEQTRAAVSLLLRTEKQELPETPQMKQVVGHMLETAKNLSHEHIGTEHLLLALLHDREGIAVRALEALGVDIDRLHAEAAQRLPAGSPEAIARKKALEQRFRDHPEVLCIKQQIYQLQRSLEQAVAAMEFDKAAVYRDQRAAATEQLKLLLTRLDQSAQDTPQPPIADN